MKTNGIGFGTLLFLVFLVLKLTGVIAWSWLWVTAPLWIPFLAIVLLLAVSGLLVVFGGGKVKKSARAQLREESMRRHPSNFRR